MRVAMYHNNSDVRIEQQPVPVIGRGEALVKVEVSGICGSDVMEWYRKPRAPTILGHEIAGSVASTGGDLPFKVGDRVTAAHHVPCNACYLCLRGHHTMCELLHKTNFDPGGFAEYVRLSEVHVDRGVFPLPDGVTYEEGVLTEPLACVLRGQRIAGVDPEDSVLVIGAGVAGLLHIKLARASGVSRIFAADIRDYRIRAARQLGVDEAWSANEDLPKRVREANDGRLMDVVIVCTGAPAALESALSSVAPGATILFFAPSAPGELLRLPFNGALWRRDLTITTSYGASPSDYAAALQLIGSKRVTVKDMITHRLGLSDVSLGFRLVAEAGESMKVVLDHSA